MMANHGTELDYVVADGVFIKRGQKAKIKVGGFTGGQIKPGELVSIHIILVEPQNGDAINIDNARLRDINVGIRSDTVKPGLHDLNGRIEQGRGWWVRGRELLNLVDLTSTKYYVKEDVNYRGQNLKGRKCELIFAVDTVYSVVSFKEDVGGFSADGMTKKGHCLIVERSKLEPIKEDEELEKSRSGKEEKKKKKKEVEQDNSYEAYITDYIATKKKDKDFDF